ncbi:MAG: NAD(P)/FAD-dependent oxidoreductase [Aeromicrobium sp.]
MTRVAVLGAGPMGLAVAYQLVQDGHQPVIYEAGPRIGGMTTTFDFEGTVIERFYHFHCTSDVDYFELLDELGLGDKMKWSRTRMGLYHGGRVQRWGDPIALLRFRGMGLIAKFRYGLHAFISVKRNKWDKLDKLEATSWVRRWIGQKAYDVTWRALFDLKFYDYAHSLSAAWIWSRVRRIGRSRTSIFAEQLGALEGGSDVWLAAIEQRIVEGGGEIRLSTPVTEVVVADGTVQGVQTASGLDEYDRVVSTVPLPYVAPMIPALPDEILDKYRAQRNVAVVCVIAKLRRSLTENFWLNVNDPDMDIPGLVEYSHLRQDLDAHIVYVPFYLPGEHPKYADADDVFTTKAVNYFKRINPEITDDDILAIRASRYRFAQPVCGPAFLETLPPWRLPVTGLFAADTSYYYPEDRGISESVKFGRMLATEIVRD